jgi:hypothetical protein
MNCKIVTVVLGDNPYCIGDIEMSLNLGIPIIVVEGSNLANEAIEMK